MRRGLVVPEGYSRHDERGALIVVRDDVAAALIAAYRGAPADAPTLHGFASRIPAADVFQGREKTYAITVPGTDRRIFVRHNRHGGLLRGLTGDLFMGATRAPLELEISLSLQALEILTPTVLGYAVYPAGGGFSRSDVVTEAVPHSSDLGDVLLAAGPEDPARANAWNAVEQLLDLMTKSGVRHHDLNVKNILLRRREQGGYDAFLLDVDRVEFGWMPFEADRRNWARLLRSVEKWRDTRGAAITAAEIDALRGIEPSTP